jgi:hypothetical protein
LPAIKKEKERGIVQPAKGRKMRKRGFVLFFMEIA